MQELLQFPTLNQLLQMTPQRPAILYSVPLPLMVLVVKDLVMLRKVSPHLVWPFKVQLTLNFFQDLMHRLLEHSANYLSSSRFGLPSKISPRSVAAVSIRPKIYPMGSP